MREPKTKLEPILKPFQERMEKLSKKYDSPDTYLHVEYFDKDQYCRVESATIDALEGTHVLFGQDHYWRDNVVTLLDWGGGNTPSSDETETQRKWVLHSKMASGI